jgi:hypothetical protein
VTFNVSDDQTWPSVTPTTGSTGTTGTTLTVTADPTGVTAGTHYGIVTITANGYQDATVDVSFSVSSGTVSITQVQKKAVAASYPGTTVMISLAVHDFSCLTHRPAF